MQEQDVNINIRKFLSDFLNYVLDNSKKLSTKENKDEFVSTFIKDRLKKYKKKLPMDLIKAFVDDVYTAYIKTSPHYNRTQNPTDAICCFIQNDREWLHRYITLVVKCCVTECKSERYINKYLDNRRLHPTLSKLIKNKFKKQFTSNRTHNTKSAVLVSKLYEQI